MGLTFAVIGDIVSPRQRGRYIGYLAGVWMFASVIGPLLGGFIVDHVTWRWVFLINLPVGGAALAVIWVVLRLPPVHRPARIDFAGAALLMAGVSLLLLALVRVQEGGARVWDASASGLTAAGVLLIGVFIRWEAYVEHPLLPLRLFSKPHLLDRVGAWAAHRLRAVRRRRLPASVSAGRRRAVGDQLRPAAAAADGRRPRRLRGVGPADGPDRALPHLPDRRQRLRGRGHVPPEPVARRDPPSRRLGVHGAAGFRGRHGHAGVAARRTERGRASGSGHRHRVGAVLPVDGRLVRRGGLRRGHERAARRQSCRRGCRRRRSRRSTAEFPICSTARPPSGPCPPTPRPRSPDRWRWRCRRCSCRPCRSCWSASPFPGSCRRSRCARRSDRRSTGSRKRALNTVRGNAVRGNAVRGWHAACSAFRTGRLTWKRRRGVCVW